jgi:xanthine dehydrogenase YagR molybdenum-binding subunit
MADYSWPEAGNRALIGRRLSRRDGAVKSTGRATYSRDIRRPGMLYGAIVTCPHAHAKITNIDVSAAKSMPGVKAIRILQDVGAEIKWAHAEVVALAATSEPIARDAVRAVKVDYEVLSHFVDEENVKAAPETKPAEEEVTGDPDAAMSSAAVKSSGYYGLPTITHCCLETHGQVSEWEDDEHLTAWVTTQAVSGVPGQIAESVGVPAANVRCITHHMGGGFGSKFGPDRWGIECAELARDAGKPVKLFLDREMDQAVAGARPSAYAEVEVGATKDGQITAWVSRSWGSGGPAGSGSPPLPYVWTFENQKHQHTSVSTNVGPARAWRAPGHPQGCFITMGALEDLAAKLEMDPLDLFLKNIAKTGARAREYEEELNKAAELMEWRSKWHPRGRSGSGPVKRGLGLGLHTWGGRGHNSNCEMLIYPDGLVEARLGSQDLGTGTKTVIGIVTAETMGIDPDDVKVSVGDSRFPASGASGGSTTVGGVSSSSRRASMNALEKLFEQVAPYLEATPDNLEARDGKVQVKGNPDKSLTWKQATAKLGVNPIVANGQNPGPGKLIDSGVGGVQMAEVSVDTETGIVTVDKIVAVQDCGLIIDLKTAESQVHGAVIMGISYSLYEERIYDPHTGRMLNAEMDAYKLARFGDIPEIVVHMMTGPGYDERGVIGLGEPPVISPGAAISNSVANAIGVRVPYLPLTPDRVLDALEKGGRG